MKILVTGASGYLGGRLVLALVHSAHDVRALVRKSSKVKDLPPLVELAYGDILDLDSLVAAADGCDAVFHAAAMVGSWLPDESLFCKVNVEGFRNVIEAVKRTPSVKRLIYTSSFFALGPAPAEGQVVDETQLHSGEDFTSEYERSKFMADAVARDAAKDGVEIIMLYPGVVYGPGALTSGNFLADMLIERFNGRFPGYPGSGNDRHSFVHVDDVVSGHISALQMGGIGERYLLTGEAFSMVGMLDLAASLTNTSKPRFTIPLWLLTAAGHANVLWARLSGQKPVITPQAVAVMKKQWIYTSAKAEKELGFESRPFKEGLGEILVWLKDLQLIKY